MESMSARIKTIARHRIAIDGDGVTTLVVFQGCPLCCRYCINSHTLTPEAKTSDLTPLELYEIVKIDSLYFTATGGGITFGGGEPGLHPEFIRQFRELCGSEWKIRLETSLNIPQRNLSILSDCTDQFIIDIKDLDPAIYKAYTLTDNHQVRDNLMAIADAGLCGKCVIRLPLIPGFNCEDNRNRSRKWLEDLGFVNFDPFQYKIKENRLWHEANRHVKS